MLDSTDTRLLAALQKDAHLTAHQLGELLVDPEVSVL